MQEQSYKNHARYFPLQHFIWLPLSLVMLVSIIVYIVYQLMQGEFTVQLLLLFGIAVLAIIPGMLARIYAVKLQDRLIRTEEQLRYYILTNKRMNTNITIKQLIALRFATDEEFVTLVDRTVNENLSHDEIKQAIQVWRADHYRV